MIKVKLLILMIGVVLCGCSIEGKFTRRPSAEISTAAVFRTVKYLKYVKDSNTGLCYATLVGESSGMVILFTYVPCDSIRNVIIEEIK